MKPAAKTNLSLEEPYENDSANYINAIVTADYSLLDLNARLYVNAANDEAIFSP